MLDHTYITYRLHRLQSRAFRLTETPFDVRSPEFVITPTEIFHTVAGSISPLIRTGLSIHSPPSVGIPGPALFSVLHPA